MVHQNLPSSISVFDHSWSQDKKVIAFSYHSKLFNINRMKSRSKAKCRLSQLNARSAKLMVLV